MLVAFANEVAIAKAQDLAQDEGIGDLRPYVHQFTRFKI